MAYEQTNESDIVKYNDGTRGRKVSIVGQDGVAMGAASVPVATTSADGQANTAGARNAGQAEVRPFVFNGTTWDRQKKPNTVRKLVASAAATNATSAKAGVTDLFKVVGYNSVASVRYLKLYDKATAPTVGTDVPFLTLPLLPSAGFSFDFQSLYFTLGLAFALTTLPADNDATAVAANDILGLNLIYQ